MVEIHPFTIASVADSPNAKERATGRTSFSIWLVTIWVLRIRKVSVIVEGPYGGLGNWMKASFSAIVLVVGGSGISFSTSKDNILAPISFPFAERLFRSTLSYFITWSSDTPHSSKKQMTVLSRQRYQMNDIDTPSGLLVGICGLVNLVESVHAAVSNVGTQRKDEVGYSRDSYRYESLDLQKVVPLETAVAYCQHSISPVDEELVNE
ncbi:hypothetical protein F5051DRAFT_429077 [Lentinula edodes]|nr:hypothetical protein F5051DRAFT_429077 [Lentinula edodes]